MCVPRPNTTAIQPRRSRDGSDEFACFQVALSYWRTRFCVQEVYRSAVAKTRGNCSYAVQELNEAVDQASSLSQWGINRASTVYSRSLEINSRIRSSFTSFPCF